MNVKEFVARIEAMHFFLTVQDGKLILKGNKQVLGSGRIDEIRNNAEIVDYIKANKDELIAYIQSLVRNNADRPQDVLSMYGLSGLQEGMLFYGLYANNGRAYHMQLDGEISGLDIGLFGQSWEEVLRRHTILRSGFHYRTFKTPVQVVYRTVDLPFTVVDLRHLSAEDQSESAADWVIRDREKGFVFESAPLMRIALFRLGEDRYRMLWSWHHLLLDGWSTAVLMEELMTIYELLARGAGLAPAPVDNYEDHIRYLAGRDARSDEAYWQTYLSGVVSGCLLPFIATTMDRNKGVGEYHTEQLRLCGDAVSRVARFAQQHKVTVNTIMQGVWAYLLHRYTGQRDVIFGVTVSGRREDMDAMEDRVGMYINVLPMRVGIEDKQPVADWLTGLQEGQAASREHQYTSLATIGRLSGLAGKELFDSLLTFDNYPVDTMLTEADRDRKLQVGKLALHAQTNYPLTIMIHHGKELVIQFGYNSDLLDEATLKRISGHFDEVLKQLTDGSVNEVGALEPMTAGERELVLSGFNDTAINYPRDRTILDLIEAQVWRSPGAAAIVFEGKTMTYWELEARSNQLGHHLRALGVREDRLVPICLERGFAMMIGILGILKAGGAYVPIDPEYPAERIQFMLEDIGAPWVVTDLRGREAIGAAGERQVVDCSDWSSIASQSTGKVLRSLLSEHLAYMIYTSGSTGTPKGVLVEHGSLANRLRWAQGYFCLSADDLVLQKTTYCFDVSVWELLWPLINGAVVVFARPGGHRDSRYLKDLIRSEGVTMAHFVPSMLEVFLQDTTGGDCGRLRRVLCSGEALRPDQVKLFKLRMDETVELYNLYGPTEAAIDVTCWRAPEGEVAEVPIGRPVWNTNLYIVNDCRRLCPIGVPGELLIGGVQVARGYWKRPELTAERFIANPFGPGRLYRTGDQCRWMEDGNIAYMGRFDNQVKVRGYRIEPGEIEAAVGGYPGVKQAVVLAREDGHGQKRLVGYVVTEGVMDKSALEGHIGAQLPEYMIPRQWVELESLPLTGSGKVDRKALPEPDVSGLSAGYEAPRSGMEETLVQIWQELLGLDRVGINDNFFESGGSSILIIKLASKLELQLQKSVNITTLFEYPTIRRLASHLEVRQAADRDIETPDREDLLQGLGSFIDKTDNIENEAYERV